MSKNRSWTFSVMGPRRPDVRTGRVHVHPDQAHQRHSFRILRRYRHMLYHDILERLPYYEVTPPKIDWTERSETVRGMLAAGS